MKKLCLLLFTTLFLFHHFNAQVIGSTESGDIAPQEAKAAELSTGSYNGDINLFSGTYSGSYPLGSVSTPQFAFDLSMNYGASFVTGDNPMVTKGIPYGEGWNVSVPTINVKNDVYHTYSLSDECIKDNPENTNNTYQFPLFGDHNEGDVYWFAPEINIPGVASGRAVFKYIDKNSNAAVFVLQNFEEYIELEYLNGHWVVKLPNGVFYEFKQVQANYRQASNHRVLNYLELNNMLSGSGQNAATDKAILNAIIPKFEYTTWYCSRISHYNYPEQSIRFDYHKFGRFDYFKEIQGYQLYLDEHYTTLGNTGYNINVLNGTNFAFVGNPMLSYVPIYSDIFLESITSWGNPHGLIEKLELDYGTEYQFANNMLDFRDAEVCRKDSLYSSKSVALFNEDEGFDNWKRILHPKSERAYGKSDIFGPVFNLAQPPSKKNPYLHSGVGINDNVSSYFGEKISEINPAFDHGILESPRIDFDHNNIIPGDRYEIKAEFFNASGEVPFVDINILTGHDQSNGYKSITDHFTVSDNPIDGSDYTSFDREPELGEPVFSTFNRALKWPLAEGYQTSNLFTLSNFPKSLAQDVHYEGLYIQIGGANSDNNFSLVPASSGIGQSPEDLIEEVNGGTLPAGFSSYYHTQAESGENLYYGSDINGGLMAGDRIPNNFGIGLPWAQCIPLVQDIVGTPGPNLHTSSYFNFWWNTDGGPGWDSEPTKLTEATGLKSVELLRHSKNPFMLQSVNKYVRNGNVSGDGSSFAEGLKMISAVEMNYNLDQNLQVPVNNHYNIQSGWLFEAAGKYEAYAPGVPLGSDTPPSLQFEPSARFSQNVFTLSAIEKIPVHFDENRIFTESEQADVDVLTQHYEYEYISTPYAQWGDPLVVPGNYPAMSQVTNELGGVKEIEYYSFPFGNTINTVPLSAFSSVDLEELYFDFFPLSDPANYSEILALAELPDPVHFLDVGQDAIGGIMHLAYRKDRACAMINPEEEHYGSNTAIRISPLVKEVRTQDWDYAFSPDADDPEGQVGNEETLTRQYRYNRLTGYADKYTLDPIHFRSNAVLDVARGFEEVTVIEPDINGEEHRTIHYNVGRNTSSDEIYNRLLFGKLYKTEKYSGSDLIERTLNEYEYTLAYENGFVRASEKQYEHFDYADYAPYIHEQQALPTGNFNETQATGWGFYEYPGYMRAEIEEAQSNFYDNAYFVKLAKSTQTIFDRGLKISNTCDIEEQEDTFGDLANADDNPSEDNGNSTAQKAALINGLQNNSEDATLKADLESNSPLEEDIIAELILQKPSYTCELLGKQEMISDEAFDQIWNDMRYSDEEIRDVAAQRTIRSEAALMDLATDDSGTRSAIVIGEILQRPEYLSFGVSNALLNNLEMDENTLLSLFSKAPFLSDNLVNNILTSVHSDECKANILSNQLLNKNNLLDQLQNTNTHLSAEALQQICIGQGIYPNESYITYYLDATNCSNGEALYALLRLSPYSFDATSLALIDGSSVLSSEQKNLLAEYQNPDNVRSQYLDNDCHCVEEVTAQINSVTEYEYYEAEYNGRIVNDAYHKLMGLGIYSDGGNEILDDYYLKHEPSWQLYSKRSFIDELSGFEQKEEYFYYYDLKNALDRYRVPSYYSDNDYSTDDYPDESTPSTSWFITDDDFYDNGIYETPTLEPTYKTHLYNMRSLAFQKRVRSTNTYSPTAHVRSTYYEYSGEWNEIGSPEKVTHPYPAGYCHSLETDTDLHDCLDEVFVHEEDPDNNEGWHPWVFEFGIGLAQSDAYEDGGEDDDSDNGENDPEDDGYSDDVPSGTIIDQKSSFKDKKFAKKLKGDGDYKNLVLNLIQSKHRLQLKSVYEQVDEVLLSQQYDKAIYSHPFEPILGFEIYQPDGIIEVPSGQFEIDEDGRLIPVYFSLTNHYKMVFPYKVLKTGTIHERDYFGEPRVIENERGLLTQIEYGSAPQWYHHDECSDCQSGPCLSFSSDEAFNISQPTKITQGVEAEIEEVDGVEITTYVPRPDALSSTFTYHPNTILAAIEDPDGNIISQEHDHYTRMTQTFNNGDLVSEIAYHQWDNDSQKSFWEKSFDNYVESKAFYNATDAVISRSYVDPLGKAFANIARINFDDGQGNVNEFTASNINYYDNWGRVEKTFKPRAFSLSSQDFEPTFDTNQPFTEHSFEDDLRSRKLKDAPLGETINGHTSDFDYVYINGDKLICELNLNVPEQSQIMSDDPTTYWFYRVRSTDPDGKEVIEYSNAAGQKVASKQHHAITLFVYDNQGNVSKSINPIKQETIYRYNLLGQLFEKRTVDDGICRYMYDRSGNVILEQDELGRAGVALETANFSTQQVEYFRQYEYDDFNRLYRQSVVAYHPDNYQFFAGQYLKPASPLTYSFQSSTDGSDLANNIYASTNGYFSSSSTLDWLASNPGNHYSQNANDLPDDFVRAFDLRNTEKLWLFGNIAAQNNNSNAELEQELFERFAQNIPNTGSGAAQENIKGKVSKSFSYRLPDKAINGPSTHIKSEVFSYDDKNRLDWEYQAINYNGITDDTPGNSLSIAYDYDLQNNVLARYLDFENDNVLDFQCADRFDGFGRLTQVYGNFDNAGSNGNLITQLNYNNNTGLLSTKRYFNNCQSNNNAIYTEYYGYDVRDRMTICQGELCKYEMAYDGNTLEHNGISPFHSMNYNGNINAIKATYTFDHTTEDIDLFSGPTLYVYHYDELNRLQRPRGQVWTNNGMIEAGHAWYQYDLAGNILSLSRMGFNSNGTGSQFSENMSYNFGFGNNHLLSTTGSTASSNRSFLHNAKGQLTQDNYREIENIHYRSTDLPQDIEKNVVSGSDEEITQIAYFYDHKDQRIVKEQKNGVDVLNTEIYWRDHSGKELAVTNIASDGVQDWTYYLFTDERIAKIKPNAQQAPQFRSELMAREDQTGDSDERDEIVRMINEAGAQYPIDITLGTWISTGEMIAYTSEYYINHLENDLDYVFDSRILVESEDQLLSLDRDGGGEALSISISDLLNGGNGTGSVNYVGPNGPYDLLVDTHLEGASFYVNDHLGNTRIVFNRNTCSDPDFPFYVESAMDYYPFGKILREYHAGQKEKYQTTQHERDGETGFDYRGARIYDSDLGVFLSIDPHYANYPNLSPYVYVNDNPILFIDPDGLDPYLFFNGGENKIYIYEDNGTPDDYSDDYLITSGNAHNEVARSSNGKWEDGGYDMLDRNYPHTHGSQKDKRDIVKDSENGAYGSGGIFRAQNFWETTSDKQRTGMGFHAGRANKDFLNRVTMGCVRLESEDFFQEIIDAIEEYGPLGRSIFYDNKESDNSEEAEEIWNELHPNTDSPVEDSNDEFMNDNSANFG